MKEDTKSLVSVFVPYYNDSAFLRECIESILNQSYNNFELVLLDHASTDNSSQIAHSYADQRIKHINMKRNLGAGGGALVNEFLKVARGTYVKLFCADDVMCVDCLATFVDFVEQHPQIDVVFGNIQYIDSSSKSLNANWFKNRRYFNINDTEQELLIKFEKGKSFLPYIGSFVRRESFNQIRLNETFIMLFDVSLWVEMILTNQRFGFLDKIIAYYRIHQNQVSSVKNNEKSAIRTYYESIAYCDIFYSHAKKIDVARKICVDSPFIEKLDVDDINLIEFVIAHYFLTGQCASFKMNAYLRLEKMLSDEALRSKIEKKFSYGIADFRRDYSMINPVSFKRRIYKKRPESLNFGEISYLLFRSVWNLISLRNMRKKKKFTL